MSTQNVEFIGLDRVFAGITRIERRIVSLRPLWERFGKEFYRQETAWFASEPWTPLSPEYAERKRKEFGAKPLLRATDALFKSLTQEGAEGNIHEVNDLGARFGSNEFKAGFHHTGTSRMPKRDPFAEPDIDRYETIAGEYVTEIMEDAGFH